MNIITRLTDQKTSDTDYRQALSTYQDIVYVKP